MTLGLVLSLTASADSETVLNALQPHPGLELGEVAGCWLPLAAEVENDAAARTLHDWLAEIPGVAFVDVVHVCFENDAVELAMRVHPDQALPFSYDHSTPV